MTRITPNRRMFARYLAPCALLLLLAPFAASWAMPPFGGQPHGGFGGDLFFLEHMAQKLDLSDDQRKQVEAIMNQQREQARPYVKTLVETRREMRHAMKGDDFDEAGRQMGQAEGNLGEGRGSAAVDNQGDALDALRRGAQDMMSQMQQALQQGEGEGEGQGDPNGTRNAGDRDPLGRPRATNGPDFGESVDVPDEIDVQRAREILEAIRKRLGDALSPDIEKDYLERLLEMR